MTANPGQISGLEIGWKRITRRQKDLARLMRDRKKIWGVKLMCKTCGAHKSKPKKKSKKKK